MKPKHKLFLFLSLFSIAISACSVAFSTHIKPNGSGTFAITVRVDERDILFMENDQNQDIDVILMEEFETTDREEICELVALESDFPFPAVAKYKQRGKEDTCEITINFENLDELIVIYNDMFSSLDGNISMNELGELNYKLNLNPNEFSTAEEIGVPEIEYLWSVSAPGKISGHNAEQERGNLLTWELKPGKSSNIEVTSAPKSGLSFSGDGMSIWWVIIPVLACLCFVGLITLGVVVFLLIRRNRNLQTE